MKPYYKDANLTIFNADVLAGLAALEAGSVQCCVTSPPYWGLRDYGTASWAGGDAGCDHVAGSLAWSTPTEQAKKRVDSGTVLKVAEKLNRKAVGIELNAEYCELAKRRLEQGVLPLGV